MKHADIIFYFMFFAVIAYFFCGEIFLPADRPAGEYVDIENTGQYTAAWERIKPDGTREPIKIPGKCKADRNELVIVETTLPASIEHDSYLCFRSAKQDMRFYIDGELQQEYSTKDSRLFGRMSAAAYVFLKIGPEDAGKTLRLETRTDSSYSGIFYAVYDGIPMGVWSYFFKQFGVELIVAFITLILSLIAIIASITLRFFYHKRVALEYLGWGIMVAALWLITNSTFRQLIFPNISVINDMTFFMIMLLALPYLLYMNEIQKGRYQKAYHVMEGVVTINFLLCTGLHITNLCDFTDTIAYVSSFCIFSIILMIVTILIDFKRGYLREYYFVAIGMSGVCIAAFIQIIIYFQRINLFNGVILAVGLIFLLLFSTISTVREIMFMEREKQHALMSSETKGRFLANMSHEIRTPINAVLGMDAMILRESKEPQIREYANDIKNAGQTLLSLINDILDISKIESGKLEIIPVDYDVSSLIHDVMNMIEMKARDKGLKLMLSIEENMPSRLWGDDVRLRQILVNLMNNAVKYTETGSVKLTVSTVTKGDMAAVTFCVEDTGIGIRKEDMERLFEAFSRIEEQRNRNIEGTGLGMSITTQLLERMGSRLQVDSVYGKGSKFYFSLEQKIMNAEPIGDLEQRIRDQATAYSYRQMFLAPDARVLVVDDNEMNRRVFRNLLKATQIQLDEAAGGEECLALIKERKYDLIFLDHMMPDLDGVEVLHKIQTWESYPSSAAPIIALTANAVTGAREMYIKEGFDDFLSKPIQPEKLEKMVMEKLPPEKVIYKNADDTIAEAKQEAEMVNMALPDLEGIDWKYARLYCKDISMLKDTIQLFYASAESEALRLEQILEQLQTSEAREQLCGQFRIKAHSMKNSAAMLGAIYLAGAARMLEYAARDQRTDILQCITPVFLKDWRSMRGMLKDLVEEEERNEQKQKEKADKGMLKELLHLLQNAIEIMDIDTSDEIVKQLKSYAYPETLESILEEISLAVSELDEERTVMGIKKFEEELQKEV